MAIEFINPRSGNQLVARGDRLEDAVTGQQVATVLEGVPRFVSVGGDYSASFGWQWNHWQDVLSDSRSPGSDGAKRRLLLERTHFDEFDVRGKTLLECGMGGGDDTEVLLQLPFGEVHSFDLSHSVDRAKRTLRDPRLTLSQADIFEIPYPDETFDFVFCHRVLQHTPQPAKALRSVARKVKRGGVLFVHSYHLSPFFLVGYKYKYRWFTKRVPSRWVMNFLDRFGAPLYAVNERVSHLPYPARLLAYNFVPFERLPTTDQRSREERIDLCKLVTFDALTPKYDKPMTWRAMRRIVESEGFTIRHAEHRSTMPLWCTAVRN